ncbi:MULTISPECIES: ferredoxin--NADP reductase [Rhodococcus]|uniref:Ferredoxin--NADP reductase n=1 Tax=Rhodococcus rhodochrous TaxID=1829 RepID=A0AAW4XBH4_RHORH|nr:MULTISPECIES: ferredoxin--NADP reductase [Rhodococcus]MCD2110435.1 ferredoxin--NADP reductase [Rhodococcus rhodochrous]QHG80948.1 ferredoxin--NADP reductase [Rhodococcus rhodochrous]QOH55040.1 3-ketosteroid-9-alpha-hydroxylase [Rhodococcus rhodochrous]WAL47109.1 ferredoxin--NADP reductase [Rhodococcus pyridinivorans]
MTAVETPVGSRSIVLTVSAVVQETADAVSLVFDVPEDRRADFTYKPGQFLTLRIPSDMTGSVARCYSLASSPHADEPLKVTVKRTAAGYGSNWLCDNVAAGQSIEVLPPAGVFTPVDLTEKLVLFAGGSGITPVMSILKSALHSGNRNVVVVYGNRDEKSVIFAEELRELAARHSDALTVVHWLESVQGLPSPQQLATLISSFADHRAYMCGPGPFMDTVREGLLLAGVPKDRIHAEVFISLSGDPFADVPAVEIDESDTDAASVTVQLDGEEHDLVWPRSATLVDIMLSKGLDVPYSCREGECGSCACTVVEGEVDTPPSAILDEEDIANGYVLACQARPKSKNVRIDF